mmetsp:Transcript_91499/g.296149  ORF Transcript_91499/g.296149 Transcript_91499/m.296149 type:complete len:246 (+) Transcript_91499:472-1209(+)
MWFSKSIEDIHSPPDLMTSLERSVMLIAPSSSSLATSPVISQPLWNLSFASNWKYSAMIHGPRISSSPGVPRGISLSRSSESAMRISTPGIGKPAFVMLLKSSVVLLVRSLCFTMRLPTLPRGFVSVMPHPWRKSTPRLSANHRIIAAGGDDPPQVKTFRCKNLAIFSRPRFMMAPFTPCHTVGTPVLNWIFQSTMASRSESGSINLPVKTIRVPNIKAVNGTPQLKTWNIGTNGKITCEPLRPN